MRLPICVTLAAIMLVTGCAGFGSIQTIAPKFAGYPVENMATYYGAPVRVSQAGSLTFYEWRIGEYGTIPDRISGSADSNGNVSGTVVPGGTQFRGCIIKAIVNENGYVTRVATEEKQGRYGDALSIWGCSEPVRDPFQAQAVAQAKLDSELSNLDQSSRLTVGMTTDQVREIMGDSVKQFLVHGMEEWHYCATGVTGVTADKFVTLYFDQKRLVTQDRYIVTSQDTGGVNGHCSIFVRQGSYNVPSFTAQH